MNDSFYQALVDQICDAVNEDWNYVKVEVEIDVEGDDYEIATTGMYKIGENDMSGFVANKAIVDMLEDLYEQMAGQGKFWKKATFEIYDNGQFSLEFDYL